MDKTIEPQKARQGRRGRRVLIVLVAALVLACLAWAAAELYGEAIDSSPDTGAHLTQPS